MDAPELAPVLGEEIGTISFVRDYLEVGFDGPVLRLLGKISLEDLEGAVTDGEPSFEHRLRRLIGGVLESLVLSDHGVACCLADGRRIAVIRDGGPEFLHYVVNGRTLVW